MPAYRSRCSTCESLFDFVRKIDERDDTPECCGLKTTRVLVAPMVQAVTITQGILAGDGNTYYGKADYENYLNKNGLVPLAEIKGEAAHQRKQIEADKNAEIRREIEDIVRSH